MRRKSIFKQIVLVGLILLLSIFSTSCGWEYLGYPVIDLESDSNGNVFLVYEGSKYYRTDEIGEDPFVCTYFLNYEEREIIGANEVFVLGRLPVYVSPKDEEKMVIEVRVIGGPGYFIKEGFELPDIENSIIDKIFLQSGHYDIDNGDAKRSYIDDYGGDLRLHDIVELEQNVIDGQLHYYCYLELENFDFLKIGKYSIIENENCLYLRHELGNPYEEDIYYRIKDEYQETFRNAINELNNA